MARESSPRGSGAAAIARPRPRIVPARSSRLRGRPLIPENRDGALVKPRAFSRRRRSAELDAHPAGSTIRATSRSRHAETPDGPQAVRFSLRSTLGEPDLASSSAVSAVALRGWRASPDNARGDVDSTVCMRDAASRTACGRKLFRLCYGGAASSGALTLAVLIFRAQLATIFEPSARAARASAPSASRLTRSFQSWWSARNLFGSPRRSAAIGHRACVERLRDARDAQGAVDLAICAWLAKRTSRRATGAYLPLVAVVSRHASARSRRRTHGTSAPVERGLLESTRNYCPRSEAVLRGMVVHESCGRAPREPRLAPSARKRSRGRRSRRAVLGYSVASRSSVVENSADVAVRIESSSRSRAAQSSGEALPSTRRAHARRNR